MRTYKQLRRILALIEVLSRSRFGLSLAEIMRSLFDAIDGPVSEKTVRRDLDVLEDMRIARVESRIDGTTVWRWERSRATVGQ